MTFDVECLIYDMLLPPVMTVGHNIPWAGCQRALVAQEEGRPFHRLATPLPRVTNNAVDVRVHFYSRGHPGRRSCLPEKHFASSSCAPVICMYSVSAGNNTFKLGTSSLSLLAVMMPLSIILLALLGLLNKMVYGDAPPRNSAG